MSNHQATEDMKAKDKTIKDLKSKLSMLELEVGQNQYMSKVSSERNAESKVEMLVRCHRYRLNRLYFLLFLRLYLNTWIVDSEKKGNVTGR